MKYLPSIFNDVIGPVMRGPSSSHTAAAHRIGTMVRQTFPPPYSRVIVRFDRTGSLPTTYLGQGSALGLSGGLLGIEITDPSIIEYEALLNEKGLRIEYLTGDLENKHPNGYDITIERPGLENAHLFAVSTGGGMVEISRLRGFDVSIRGDLYENLLFVDKKGSQDKLNRLAESIRSIPDKTIHTITGKGETGFLITVKSTGSVKNKIASLLSGEVPVIDHIEMGPVLPVMSRLEYNLPFKTVAGMLDLGEKEGLSLSELAFRYECARSGLSPEPVRQKMADIVEITRNSIREGLLGTRYEDRILGPQAGLIEKAEKEGKIAPSMVNSIIACTSALMEVKSAMGLIVATPTAGSCGVLGGAMMGSREGLEFDTNEMVNGFMAAGMAGVFIADQYSFSAEEGGCQVETGSGAAMAAAGLTDMNGGTAAESVRAASMALQNQLGLICDPVAVRVEVPCLGKNVLAASNAYNSYVMALSGFDPVIPYEEVIGAMKAVGEALPSSLCCTGLGGLAQTPTGKQLNKKYNGD